jgi:hypothetical protein
LFARAQWLSILQTAGFQPEIALDEYQRDIFVARKWKS